MSFGSLPGADVRGVVAVVDLLLEDDVRQRVPLRPGLQREDEQIIRTSDVSVPAAVEVAHRRIRHRPIAVSDHEVDRVEPSETPGLGTVLIDRDRQREDLSGTHEFRRRYDILGLDVVKGSELVVRPPAAPVGAPFTKLADGIDPWVLGDFDDGPLSGHSSRSRTLS